MIRNSFKGIMKFNVMKYNNDILLNVIFVQATPKIKKNTIIQIQLFN